MFKYLVRTELDKKSSVSNRVYTIKANANDSMRNNIAPIIDITFTISSFKEFIDDKIIDLITTHSTQRIRSSVTNSISESCNN